MQRSSFLVEIGELTALILTPPTTLPMAAGHVQVTSEGLRRNTMGLRQ